MTLHKLFSETFCALCETMVCDALAVKTFLFSTRFNTHSWEKKCMSFLKFYREEIWKITWTKKTFWPSTERSLMTPRWELPLSTSTEEQWFYVQIKRHTEGHERQEALQLYFTVLIAHTFSHCPYHTQNKGPDSSLLTFVLLPLMKHCVHIFLLSNLDLLQIQGSWG